MRALAYVCARVGEWVGGEGGRRARAYLCVRAYCFLSPLAMRPKDRTTSFGRIFSFDTDLQFRAIDDAWAMWCRQNLILGR